MRLIDADALLDKLCRFGCGCKNSECPMVGDDSDEYGDYCEHVRIVMESPTVVDTKRLWIDMRCLETLDDMLDPVDDDTSLIHFRVDDVQQSLYAAAQDLWILQGGKGRRMHWDGDPCPVRLGSEANGCWIKCKDCANTRCTRRHVEEDGDDE